MNLKIEYLNKLTTKIQANSYDDNKWYDLRASNDVKIKSGESAKIPLGIKIDLPEEYEIHIILKRNTFDKYGLILPNGAEIISSKDKDELSISVYATKDIKINFNDRICQFRVFRIQEKIDFI